MNLALLVYLVSRISPIEVLLVSTIMVLAMSIIVILAYNVDEKNKKSFKIPGILLAVCALGWVVLPNEKTVYLMLGAYAAQTVYETPEAKEIGNDVLHIIRNKVKEYANEKEPAK